MTADRVDYTNLFSESWNNIYQLIKDTSNVPDPISSSGQYRKWVYSREPDVKASDFGGYPFIIVYPSEFDQEQEGSSHDGKSKFLSWPIEIEVVTSDRGYGCKDGLGQSHLDTISNSIVQTLNDVTNRALLRRNGLYFVNPKSGGQSQDPLAKELVYRRSFMLALRGKMQVSR